jgi:hypothetical protein
MLPHLTRHFLIFENIYNNFILLGLSSGDSFGDFHFTTHNTLPFYKNLILRFKEASEMGKGWSSNIKLPFDQDVKSGRGLYPT